MKIKYFLIAFVFSISGTFLMSQTLYVTNDSDCDLLVQGVAGTSCTGYNCQTAITQVNAGSQAQPIAAQCVWSASHKWVAVKYYKIAFPPVSGGVGARITG